MIGTMAAAGTFALFSDTEASNGNTFTAGSLDYVLNPTAAWDFPFTNVFPGFTTGTQRINLVLAPGSIAPNHVEAKIEAANFIDGVVASGGVNTLDDYTKQIEVQILRYNDGAPGTPNVNMRTMANDAADGNVGFISLFDVIQRGVYDNLPPVLPGNTARIVVQLGLPGDLPAVNDNLFQGDSLDLVINTAAAQVAGQNVLN